MEIRHECSGGIGEHGQSGFFGHKLTRWLTDRKIDEFGFNLRELIGRARYGTVWTRVWNLRWAVARANREKLSGRVELGTFRIDDHRPGGGGREKKDPISVILAVERSLATKEIGRVRLDFTRTPTVYSLASFIRGSIDVGSVIATDGWSGYDVIDDAHYRREISIPHPYVNSVNLYGIQLLGTLVRRLVPGTFDGPFEPKYLRNHMDRYVLRFNAEKPFVKHEPDNPAYYGQG
jgi:hypothetical protein